MKDANPKVKWKGRERRNEGGEKNRIRRHETN